jgi:hypothetical protein
MALPCGFAGRPAEPVRFEQGAGVSIGFAWQEQLQPRDIGIFPNLERFGSASAPKRRPRARMAIRALPSWSLISCCSLSAVACRFSLRAFGRFAKPLTNSGFGFGPQTARVGDDPARTVSSITLEQGEERRGDRICARGGERAGLFLPANEGAAHRGCPYKKGTARGQLPRLRNEKG